MPIPALLPLIGKIASVAAPLIVSAKDAANRKAIAKENLRYQQQQVDYQKAMQREAWHREDTAVQRRKEDMIRAGFNPVLAIGSPAQSSSPVAVGTPQREQIPLTEIKESLMRMPEIAQSYAQLQYTQQQIEESMARVDTEQVKQDNMLYERSKMGAEIARLLMENKNLAAELKALEGLGGKAGASTFGDVLKILIPVLKGK